MRLLTNDAALSLFDTHRASVVAALRGRAKAIYYATKEPVHIEMLHPVLKETGYTGDPRILGSAFRDWKPVGWTNIRTMQGRTRMVRLFVPSLKE